MSVSGYLNICLFTPCHTIQNCQGFFEISFPIWPPKMLVIMFGGKGKQEHCKLLLSIKRISSDFLFNGEQNLGKGWIGIISARRREEGATLGVWIITEMWAMMGVGHGLEVHRAEREWLLPGMPLASHATPSRARPPCSWLWCQQRKHHQQQY